jgi:hypothetical protein
LLSKNRIFKITDVLTYQSGIFNIQNEALPIFENDWINYWIFLNGVQRYQKKSRQVT